MTLQNAGFLAFVAAFLLSIRLAFTLIRDLISVIGGLIPALAVLDSLLYTFAAIALALFFYVFWKAPR